MEPTQQKVSFGQRWSEARPKKTIVFWSWIAAMILTMIVGFSWGGWVTGGTALKMADNAIVQRLAPICVGQFNQDPGKDQKFKEFNETNVYSRRDYVEKQGWATMSGEAKPDRKVADACAKLLTQISQ